VIDGVEDLAACGQPAAHDVVEHLEELLAAERVGLHEALALDVVVVLFIPARVQPCHAA